MLDVRRLHSPIGGESPTMRMLIVLLTIITSFGSASAVCPTLNSSLIASINDFGFDIGRQLIPGQGNFFISPFSMYAAMAMVYDGTAGSSSSQISKALRLSDHKLLNEDLKNSFRDMLNTYLKQNKDYNLTVADGVFIQDQYPVKPTFVDDMKLYYQALVKTLDFANNGVAAKDEINSWVSEITRGMIKDLFPQPIDPMTRLILVNAIYFKGTWKTTFNKDSTYDGTFYKTNNEEKKVKLMKLEKKIFPFHDDISTGYKFLEMPYKGEDIIMLFALPKNRNHYPDFNMTSEKLCGIRDSLRQKLVTRIVIPKFKFEYQKELKQCLEKLGIEDIFNDGAANLSGISDVQKLSVSSIFHKAVINVNEEGSEAAAATKVTIAHVKMVGGPRKPDIDFIADHPFLFYVIDKRNGIILFSGRLDEP